MFRILTIPFDRAKGFFDDSLLNEYLLNKRVKTWGARFFQLDGEAYWTVFIDADPVLPPPGKRAEEGLSEPERLFLQRLREWRKERAEKDGTPPFIIATNTELLAVIRKTPVTLEQLRSVRGFGQGKVSRYGEEIVSLVKTFHEKK